MKTARSGELQSKSSSFLGVKKEKKKKKEKEGEKDQWRARDLDPVGTEF